MPTAVHLFAGGHDERHTPGSSRLAGLLLPDDLTGVEIQSRRESAATTIGVLLFLDTRFRMVRRVRGMRLGQAVVEQRSAPWHGRRTLCRAHRRAVDAERATAPARAAHAVRSRKARGVSTSTVPYRGSVKSRVLPEIKTAPPASAVAR